MSAVEIPGVEKMSSIDRPDRQHLSVVPNPTEFQVVDLSEYNVFDQRKISYTNKNGKPVEYIRTYGVDIEGKKRILKNADVRAYISSYPQNADTFLNTSPLAPLAPASVIEAVDPRDDKIAELEKEIESLKTRLNDLIANTGAVALNGARSENGSQAAPNTTHVAQRPVRADGGSHSRRRFFGRRNSEGGGERREGFIRRNWKKAAAVVLAATTILGVVGQDNDNNDSTLRSFVDRSGWDSGLSNDGAMRLLPGEITDKDWKRVSDPQAAPENLAPQPTPTSEVDPSTTIPETTEQATTTTTTIPPTTTTIPPTTTTEAPQPVDAPAAQGELQVHPSVININHEQLDMAFARINTMTEAELQQHYGNVVTGVQSARELAYMELSLVNPEGSRETFYNEIRHNPQMLALLAACTESADVSFENCTVDTDAEGNIVMSKAEQLRINMVTSMSTADKARMAEQVIAEFESWDFLGTRLHSGPYETVRLKLDSAGNIIGYESSTNDRTDDVWIEWAVTNDDGSVSVMSYRGCGQNVRSLVEQPVPTPPAEEVETPPTTTIPAPPTTTPVTTTPTTTIPETTPTTVPETTTPTTTIPETTPTTVPETTTPTTTIPETTTPTTVPETTTVPTTTTEVPTTTTIPEKTDDDPTPGGNGTPDSPGQGEAGQTPNTDGYLPSETTPSTQAPRPVETTTATTVASIVVPATEGTAPASTNPAVTSPNNPTQNNPENGPLPSQP